MTDQLLTILLVILAIGLVWWLLKAVLRLTMKVFSCGLLILLAIGALLFLGSNIEIF